MRINSLSATGLLLALLALGCERGTPLAGDVSSIQFDFMNGPSDLPNVFRSNATGQSGAGILLVWPDFETDLVIVVNAPANPSDLLACGGTERPDLTPVQSVGELQEVIKELRLLRDVNLHLYRPVPPGFTQFRELCQASPIAQGTGNATSTDNDRFVTGSGANAFGFRAQGIVDLIEGESARVTGARQLLIKPDGTCCDVLLSNVTLHAH